MPLDTYTGRAGSNQFRVHDLNAFKEWAVDHDFEVIVGASTDAGTLVSLGAAEFEKYICDDPDFYAMLATHLCRGEVMVLMETGFETDTPHFVGIAEAILWDGRHLRLSLDAIYSLAARMFNLPADSIRHCEP